MKHPKPLSVAVAAVMFSSLTFAVGARAAKAAETRNVDPVRSSTNEVSERLHVGLAGPDKPVAPPAKPYARKSLAEASHAELVRLMGPGKNVSDFEKDAIIHSRAPADFWTMKPREAALALAEANRTEWHRSRSRIEVEDPAASAPPEVCTLVFSDRSSRCYNARDWDYFLRVDPAGSYLAYGSSRSGGVVFYSVVFDQPGFDLRYCPLPYEDARQLASTIWWLDRVRSHYNDPRLESGGISLISTGDGSASLKLRDSAGVALVEHDGKMWGGMEISERWTGKYDSEVAINLMGFLVTKVLPERLGDSWKQSAPPSNRGAAPGVDRGPVYTTEQLGHVTKQAQRFFGLYSEKQDKISNTLVGYAANAAGTLALTETKESLEKIQAAKPVGWLGDVVSTSLVKIEVANDPVALHEWAASKTPGSQWAMQRLSVVDPKLYLQALEWWMGNIDPKWSRQLFVEIQRVDPARAAELVSRFPSENDTASNQADATAAGAAAVVSALDRAKKIADEPQRVAALIEVLRVPGSGWRDRLDAIDLLVPADEPLRYPQREIDTALLGVLDSDRANPLLQFMSAHACNALGLRGRTDAFDRIAEVFGRNGSSSNQIDEVLGALVRLAQADPDNLTPKMRTLLGQQLRRTNRPFNNLLMACWVLDLREFLPAMEHLATSDPGDYEDRRTKSYGGEVTAVTGGYHQARKIADLWNAADPVTEIRLLTIFVLNGQNGAGLPLAEAPCFKSALRKAGGRLTPVQRQQLDEFFVFVDGLPNENSRWAKTYRQKLMTSVKEEIAAR